MEYSLSPLEGYNVFFAAMIFLSLLYFGLSALTGVGHDADGHAADGTDMHGEIHGDLHGDGHAGDADHADAHDGHNSDHGHDEQAGISTMLIGLLNTENRCPLFFALSLLLLIWGVSGYIFNAFVLSRVHALTFSIMVIVGHAASGLAALAITRKIAPIVAQTIPTGTGSCNSFKDFVGSKAEVSSILDPQKGGMVEVNIGGSVVKVWANLVGYDGPPLKRGSIVMLTAYLENGNYECTVINGEVVQ